MGSGTSWRRHWPQMPQMPPKGSLTKRHVREKVKGSSLSRVTSYPAREWTQKLRFTSEVKSGINALKLDYMQSYS